jgi:hypothetical protein
MRAKLPGQPPRQRSGSRLEKITACSGMKKKAIAAPCSTVGRRMVA